ncbi:hypothetical protein [Fundidesulfovibrio soli]|uniref:hypothetical protein n=1 Tax=Fundidesulfovibrio soli TaxID=2922716 RepID=UPI001FAEBCE0|nr:hypothetical protein [Fundidesulfovibrio soli]
MTLFQIGDQRPIVVSNRLPVRVVREEGGVVQKQGAGRLVTAMAPVLKDLEDS